MIDVDYRSLSRFLAAESEYWKAQTEGAWATLNSIRRTASCHEKYPPEPPIGTRFIIDGDWSITRTVAGWEYSFDGRVETWQKLWSSMRDSLEHIVRVLPGGDDA